MPTAAPAHISQPSVNNLETRYCGIIHVTFWCLSQHEATVSLSAEM